MGLLLALVVLVLVLGALGFIVHLLWWLAVIALVVVLVGFVMRSGGGGRSYRS